MADQREVALNFIKSNGPVLPVQISKILNTNILFASAVLSELVERKVLKMTNAAIGGSKLYYIPNLQEPMLGDKLFNSLNPVEKEVFSYLKDKKVLRDKELEPKQRIALRDIKDFAFPLTITLGDQSEIFWKFHIISDEEAKPYIQQYIEDAPSAPVKEEVKVIETAKEEKRNEQTPVNVNEAVAKLREELIKELAPKLREKEEEISRLKEENRNREESKVKEIKTKKLETVIVDEEIEETESEETNEEEFVDKTESKRPEGKFYKEILDFFNYSGIKVLKEEMIKKEKEYDFTVKLPTAFGTLNYFVKARDKKVFNDSDVALAFSAGQLRKLPTILLGKGKLNKKGIALIDEKLNGQLVFKEL